MYGAILPDNYKVVNVLNSHGYEIGQRE
jgi:hypothetical protein